MRAAKYVKIITSQLEQFDDMKKQLESLLEDIKHIIHQGQSWIDETVNTLSFAQINQLLAVETSNCIQKCLNITLEDDKMISTTKVNISCSSSKKSSPNSDGNTQRNRDFNDIQIKLNEFDKRISEQSTQLKSLKQKVKHQEEQNEIISTQLTEKDKNTEVKFKEIMKELHAASDFMSDLQSQTNLFTNEQTEHEKKLTDVLEKLTDQEERIKVLTTNQESDMEKTSRCDKNDEKFTKMSSEFNELSTYLTEMKHLNSKKSISFSVGIKELTFVDEGCVVKYDKIFTNIADSYNVSTGIFTCSMAGHYVFHVNLTTECESVNLALFQNNDHNISVHAYNTDNNIGGGNSVILHLKVNDQVFLKAQCVSLLTGNLFDIRNTFSGFLLAAD
ncbi:hypothetical protein Btru_033858 [Bulinus truncatus]|nr:hypothetical protein Btru_033858 [Bulinus truncatus]